jgi:hypothetical protein
MSQFKKDMAGMYYIINPNGDRVDIVKTDRGWESGGSYYQKLTDAKAEIIQKIQDGGSGYSNGGLATKNYMNPVTVVDNRKNK